MILKTTDNPGAVDIFHEHCLAEGLEGQFGLEIYFRIPTTALISPPQDSLLVSKLKSKCVLSQ